MLINIFTYFLFGTSLASMYMAYFGDAPSCFLCDVERYFFIITSLFLIQKYYKFAFIALLMNLFVSTYHILLQANVLTAAPAVCRSVEIDGKRRGSCSDINGRFLNISLPIYVALISATGCGLILFRRSK